MSTDRDVTRIVRSWLEEGVTALPDRVLDTVLDQLPATPQRRAWWPARRLREMNNFAKFAIAAAAVVVIAIVGINLLPRSGGGIGGPGGASPSPTPSPSLQARMTVAGSAIQFTAEYPAPWTPFEFGVNRDGEPAGGAFFASLVDNTFSDPCAHIQRNPKVGLTVEALATALGEIPTTTATQPVQTTLAGNAATYVELTIPASPPCNPEEFYLWQDSPGAYWWALAPNELIRVWIVEVGGQRVAIAARSRPGISAAVNAELQGILESIVFDVPSTQPSTTPAAS